MKTIYIFLLALLLTATSARAGTKEDLQGLSKDISTLHNRILEPQRIFDEKADGQKSLVVQISDEVGKSSSDLKRITAMLESQMSGTDTAKQAVLQEIRNLSGKIDEQATRMCVLARQIGELKVQSQSFSQESTQGGP